MTKEERLDPVVFVLDDDASMRESIIGLLHSVKLDVRAFSSPAAFLAHPVPQQPHCLILDIQLDGEDGLSLQEELAKTRREMPIILITGHANVDRSIRAFKSGAIEFLTKPFASEALLQALKMAIERSGSFLRQRSELAVIAERYATLTARERQVLQLVVSGLLNKQIADVLMIREITIKMHRGKVMRKMAAGSLAELVRMTDKLGIEPDPSR